MASKKKSKIAAGKLCVWLFELYVRTVMCGYLKS